MIWRALARRHPAPSGWWRRSCPSCKAQPGELLEVRACPLERRRGRAAGGARRSDVGSVRAVPRPSAHQRAFDVGRQERQVVVAGERGGEKFEEVLPASRQPYRPAVTSVAVSAGDVPYRAALDPRLDHVPHRHALQPHLPLPPRLCAPSAGRAERARGLRRAAADPESVPGRRLPAALGTEPRLHPHASRHRPLAPRARLGRGGRQGLASSIP